MKPEKRLKAKDALEHVFLKEKVKPSEDSLDNKYEEADFSNLNINEFKPSLILLSINNPFFLEENMEKE